ncbi:glycosyltransferase [Acidimangrovimonas sediminis]|uniref:glycosyltransferase n=1 Tax=Acidimangrovimonas sediminis TaxID=2056283 RepID=UPI000C800069|nr:glycosyltransferase family 2 protein [Acidimangrovimonas sediminis]
MMHHFLPDLTVVVPTFEERANIRPLLARLDAALNGIAWDVIFVDDMSGDGTQDEIRAAAAEDPRVHLLCRTGRRGLAGACIEGMLTAVAPLVAVIDADLQHDERLLSEMFRRLAANADLHLVIGSRHAPGGGADGGFSRLRRWGSDRANRLARRLLGIEARDPMSGFFMLRRSALAEVACGLQPHGFKLLADMLAAARSRWQVAEIPYHFRPRAAGRSKMDLAVTLEFAALLLSRLSGGLLPVRFLLFGLVGATGVVVQLAVVRALLLVAGPDFGAAQAGGIVVAMTTNFLLNNRLTWRERRLKGGAMLRGLMLFYLVCSLGALANLAAAGALYRLLPVWWIASTGGAVAGAVWNFWASLIVTWRAR